MSVSLTLTGEIQTPGLLRASFAAIRSSGYGSVLMLPIEKEASVAEAPHTTLAPQTTLLGSTVLAPHMTFAPQTTFAAPIPWSATLPVEAEYATAGVLAEVPTGAYEMLSMVKRVRIDRPGRACSASSLPQMLMETPGNVEIADQCALRHTVVCPPILAILIQQRRQRRLRRSAFPRRQRFTERPQCASPCVNRITCRVTGAAFERLSFQTRPGICACEAAHADQRQFVRLDQLTSEAVGSEPAHPTDIDPNRVPGKMPSPPEVNNCLFAFITTFRIHALLDAAIPNGFARLSGYCSRQKPC